MADLDEEEDVQSQKLKHQLLIGLKTTVEGLLATNSSDVWSTYGGLGRLCKDVDRILSHRLKFVVGDYGSVVDYWPFIKGLKWLNPVSSPYIEKIRKGTHQKGVSKGQVWVKESLREHKLVNQLKILVTSDQHLHRHYFEDAFLFNFHYFNAMCICLQAVEENKVSLLADIDAKLLHFNPSLHKVAPSHIRSASLPMLRTSNTPKRRSHKSFSTDVMALAPPFASPQSKEHELCASDEHAVPCNIGSSTSPEEGRLTAKEALRNVLRKSGSDSPTELSPPDLKSNSYSLYNSLNSDPLLNLDLLQLSMSPLQSQENLTNKPRMEQPKKILTRSASETLVTKRISDKSASEIVDKIIHEDADDNGLFSGSKGMTFTKSMTFTANESDRVTKANSSARMIFSDSESVETDRKSRKITDRKVKHTHKRSRSDVVGAKPSAITGEFTNGQKDSGNSATGSSSTTVSDAVVGSNGSSSYFPQPQQGQSLIHYLSSHDFHTCANLEKENAHFSICEALIAAIEQMKWNHVISPTDRQMDEHEEEDSDEEIKQLQQRIRIRKREKLKEKVRGFPAFSDGRTDTTPTTSQSQSDSPFSSSHESDYSDSDTSSGVDEKQIELSLDDHQGNMSRLKNSGLSLSMASLYSAADIQKSAMIAYSRENSTQESGSLLSAESVAISLLRKFSEKQLPKASDLQWIVSEQEAPQRLLPLPNSYPISPDDADDVTGSKRSSKTRLRGNLEWAPPRPQIIFNIHTAPKRNNLLLKQNFRCAGCGMKVEPGYAKRYRYCDYLGKYFCQCCHSNQLAEIPARMLKKWDFTKYYVSNFARDFLTKIANEPLFNIMDVNPVLYKKVKALSHIRGWRIQLQHMKSLVALCKQASSLSIEISNLPSHWSEDVHTYSIHDLISVKSGALGHICSQLKHVTLKVISHVESCQHCQCFGFICEMCKNQKDVIFPYQLNKVSLCPVCKTCFHKECFVPEKCPKCARIEARKKRQQQESIEEDTEEKEHSKDGTNVQKCKYKCKYRWTKVHSSTYKICSFCGPQLKFLKKILQFV